MRSHSHKGAIMKHQVKVQGNQEQDQVKVQGNQEKVKVKNKNIISRI